MAKRTNQIKVLVSFCDFMSKKGYTMQNQESGYGIVRKDGKVSPSIRAVFSNGEAYHFTEKNWKTTPERKLKPEQIVRV